MINIERAIVNAYLGNSKLNDQILGLEGMSSSKVRHLLNNLVADAHGYLEVGCWKGSTLVSACYGNECPASAFDNFSEFDHDNQTEETLKGNVKRFLTGKDVWFHNSDFRKIPEMEWTRPSVIDLIFYDGGHSYQDQYDAIKYLVPLHADWTGLTLVIDDWNHEPTRLGTIQALKDFNFRVRENYWLPAKFNGDLDGWWNGVWIAKIERMEVSEKLEQMLTDAKSIFARSSATGLTS